MEIFIGGGGFLNEVLNEVMGCAEQYVGARRCVKSSFGGVGIGWVIPYTYFVMVRG